jgi:hypothetical protein
MIARMAEDRNEPTVDVAVVGAGPAGMMSAIAAAGKGASASIFERLDRPGVKLLATGGGRCNLTNTASTSRFLASFGRQGRFMEPALAAMDAEALRAFFGQLGVATCVDEADEHVIGDVRPVFPRSGSAADVQQALLRRCKELGVAVHLGCRVEGLWIESGRLRGLRIARSAGSAGKAAAPSHVAARRVILAAGGKSRASLGSDGSGFDLASAAGHTIVPPLPALVPLVTQEAWPGRCAGVSLRNVRVRIDLPRQSKAGIVGPVLFTHTGISGPAVLDLSGDVAALLSRGKGVPLRLELCPDLTCPWAQTLDQWGHTQGATLIHRLLERHMPAAVAEVVCSLAEVFPQAKAAHLSRTQRDALARTLTGLPLTVTGTEGFAHSMVTRGGVSLRQVHPRTLQSKLLPGLLLAGEVLDLAGPCGGYNLQWAMSSGFLAGSSAVSV